MIDSLMLYASKPFAGAGLRQFTNESGAIRAHVDQK